MPGPPRFFATNAARQRDYRRRKQEEAAAEQREAEQTAIFAYVVHRAVKTARQQGDAVAEKVYRSDAFETLRAVADHFYDLAGTPPEGRRWLKR
jgi:hypothetical protein